MGSAGGRTSSLPRLKNGPWTGELALWLWHKREVTSKEEKKRGGSSDFSQSNSRSLLGSESWSCLPLIHVQNLLSSAFYIVRLLTVLWGGITNEELRSCRRIRIFISPDQASIFCGFPKPGTVADTPILDNTIFSIVIQPAFLRKIDIFCSQSWCAKNGDVMFSCALI